MLEFKVNEYITLKLENNRTIIYIKGDLYSLLYCASILTRKTVYEIGDFIEEIESIDEITEHLDHSLEKYKPEIIDIPVKTEFWGHCSNLQVWAENNYDTRLIHSNLAFPLLKKLTEAGDPIAQKVFKEEIAKRIHSGYLPVIKFLIDEKFIDYLEKEELETIYLDANPKLREGLTISLEDRSSLRKYSRPIIKKLIELGDPSAIKFIKKNFTESVKSRDFSLSLRIIHSLDVKGPRVFYLDNNPALNDYILKMIHNKETFLKNIEESYESNRRYNRSKIKNTHQNKVKIIERLNRMRKRYNIDLSKIKNIEIPPVNEEIMEISLIFEIILTLARRGDTSAIQIYESLRQAILLDPNRKELYEFIEKNPGMNYYNILKILKDRYGEIKKGVTRNIRLLEWFEFVKGVSYISGSLMVPCSMPDRIAKLYNILRDDLNRKIIKILLGTPRIGFLELKKKLGEPERKIQRKIADLKKADLLLVKRDKTNKEREDFLIEIILENSEKCARIIKDLENIIIND